MAEYKRKFDNHRDARQERQRDLSKTDVLERVSKALDQIRYGEIVIKVQGGKPIWVDKYERERVG